MSNPKRSQHECIPELAGKLERARHAGARRAAAQPSVRARRVSGRIPLCRTRKGASMNAFLNWLENLNERDTRVRAVLRRSLAFAPGAFPAAFPYVEPFLKDDAPHWRRQAHYLVAALWAVHWKEGRPGSALPIGEAAACHALTQHTREQLAKGTSSTERRFIALLDADPEQLPHRLRQMVALLKEQPLDF